MHVALHGRELSTESTPAIKRLIEQLVARGATLYFTEALWQLFDEPPYSGPARLIGLDNKLPAMDVMISLGGDGTFLDAVLYAGSAQVPLLGINTGRLGFLATTPKDQIDLALDHLFNGDYTLENRSLIELNGHEDLFGPKAFALNELAVVKQDSSSMLKVRVTLDGRFLNAYWADGLIIATPTGSTGYSLSCGGPIVMPQSENFIITPVSPHNLNARPLVVSDSSLITLQIEGRTANYRLSLDSRSEIAEASVLLTVRKCAFKAKLIKFPEYFFPDTLRQKLNWGFDLRN